MLFSILLSFNIVVASEINNTVSNDILSQDNVEIISNDELNSPVEEIILGDCPISVSDS